MIFPRYEITLEVYESTCSIKGHKKGDTFKYPEDKGKMCQWLLAAAEPMIRVLLFDGILPWGYKGTNYEKEMDKEGITTEFVRCPDPTNHNLVLKIIRKRIDTVELRD
ncbi:MAG TPA: hypothetical protein VMZ29_09070 [Candidatus Bathyarchaeia archaeon]|nr:hypothetical protein [Candidatus Bathyarchaeia archaeon]